MNTSATARTPKYSAAFLSLLLLTSGLFAPGCNEDDPFLPDFKYAYYPLEVGHWVEYDVDSFYFFNNALPVVLKDTVSFQIREVIAATFFDAEGRLAYRVERFKRQDDSKPWEIDRVWSVNRIDANLQKVENGLRYIKLLFPPRLNETWDGNAFIDAAGDPATEYLEDWTYEITALDQPDEVGSFTFDSTMTIVQADLENLIEKTYSVEQYAKNVGLIYKELQVLFKQNVSVGWDQPELGVIVRHQIRDYQGS